MFMHYVTTFLPVLRFFDSLVTNDVANGNAATKIREQGRITNTIYSVL